jgi:L-amino acid N-acyltransferase YncA
MEFARKPTFTHRDRQDIYEYVERHGRVPRTEVKRALGFDDHRFGHQIAILKRDRVIGEVDGELHVALDDGGAESHEASGVTVTIRPARQSDLSGLVGVIRQVVETGTYVEAETVADVVDHQRVLLRHNELESRMFFVATVEGDVVGWVHLHAPETEKLSHVAQLTAGVLSEYRGRGIGSQLLDRGVEWASKNGFERLYNSVPSANESGIAFLESQGWEVEAVREGHYKIDDEYVDEVMLAYEL